LKEQKKKSKTIGEAVVDIQEQNRMLNNGEEVEKAFYTSI